ncbi:MAG TPA: potassium-transporting ATPase subunit C [Nocardioides sp.]|uniref:potassium-transporting ATPase subunit C n=1 Tax=Nocardioides sp. TaxID=35761 RepID=UPI002CBA0ABD|nr:potassium-transporting ATPase subunit C [Nocardioides sp.]HQR25405.1 potassium-transporting ATPase subunit C [Nocardioides sp.]
MRTSPRPVARHLAAVRALLVFTLLLGLAYPLTLVALARLPGLSGKADGSLVTAGGRVVGSRLLGQSFTDADGNPLPEYFQSRPSAAGNGYDPTATSASNLGPEDVVDTPERPSLLTQVCARSHAIGELEGVDGSRPYCTPDGVGAVLGVYLSDGLTGDVLRVVSLNQTSGTPFLDEYRGVPVELAVAGEDHSGAVVVPVRGDAPAHPVVPADAVTASGSGLDPHVSPAYARLQAPRVAQKRGIDVAVVQSLIEEYTQGPTARLLGEPGVNVLELNLALDERYPKQ